MTKKDKALALVETCPLFGTPDEISEGLALLLSVKDTAKLNPRITDDNALVVDGNQTYICEFSGAEYADVLNVKPVLYFDGRPGRESYRSPHYHDLNLGSRQLGVLLLGHEEYGKLLQQYQAAYSFDYWYDDEVCCGFALRSNTRHPCDDSIAFGSLARCNHETEPGSGDFGYFPRSFMHLISDMACGHDSGNYYYSCDNMPYEDTEEYYMGNQDDDDDYRVDPRGSYHESTRSWDRDIVRVSDWQKMKSRPIRERLFGVELEIKANDHDDLSSVCELAGQCGFLAEEDGSLDSSLGVEIIGEPMYLAEIASPDGNWMKFLKRAARLATCWNAGRNYSMHISVNRTAMSPATCGKFVNAIHGMTDLGVKIAGRNSHDYAAYEPGCGHIIDGANSRETYKFRAASVRSAKRVEVRIFRGSLNPARFVRNVQYCSAVWDWATVCSLSQSDNTKLFLDWLMKGNQHYYPELAAWIVDKYDSSYTLCGKARKVARPVVTASDE